MPHKSHIVLLGDSILDNARYVARGQSVVDQLSRSLPQGNTCSLLAVDGDTTREVFSQLARLPSNATHLVLSVGGNDALSWLPTLDRPCRSVLEALGHLSHIQVEFQTHYERLLAQVAQIGKPTLVCTVYDAVPGLTPALQTALSLFNDVVTRAAMGHAFEILDLRTLLKEPGDFSSLSPIEPSEQAGRKLAQCISRWANDD
jgi:lysophospholipase L1-like esterase